MKFPFLLVTLALLTACMGDGASRMTVVSPKAAAAENDADWTIHRTPQGTPGPAGTPAWEDPPPAAP